MACRFWDQMMQNGFTLDRAVSETLVNAFKAKLNSENPVADGERIVAKVIRDGTIDATIDHANGWMVSKETGDVYYTNEPQFAFSSRIAFCLNMHMRSCMP
ncbi:hypothetical protein IFM89_008665 [Coptis chinensis]|uniref:Uncharacterized protein n=1 Tax=Coptis chinensis TaxID=261450 RepID=A0A835H022_9MAGN|nr:hypothetical protein IFM89_008665 [Coptis chinensis]